MEDKILEKVKMREMKESDLEKIMDIEEQSFNNPWSSKSFRYELSQNDLAKYIVLEYCDQIIAYIGLWFINEDIHITNFAVSTEHRNMGLGHKLLKFLILLAKTRGYKYITLEVRRSNEVAISLYKKLGFKTVGVRPSYYRDNGEDAILMQKRVLRGVFT